MAAPLLYQILVELPPVEDLCKAVDAGLFAFLREDVALVDQYLNQNFEVALLPRDRIQERPQLLFRRLAFPNLRREAGADTVEMLLQQIGMLVRSQKSVPAIAEFTIEPVDLRAHAVG